MRRLFCCDRHEIPLPPGHKFPMAKYRLVRERLAASGLYTFQDAPPASAETVTMAHDAAYVGAFLDGSLDTGAMRRIGFPWSGALVRRTMCSVGGTLAASGDAFETGFGGTLAGGTHHASRDSGAGFCVFNDIAVAVLEMRRSGRAGRAAVIDLDVHQGDGTAAIFAGDPDVLTVSLHGQNNFPFRKLESSVDVALPDGTGDAAYLAALKDVLPRVAAFGPEIVYYQSGVDPLEGDRFGRLALSLDGLAARDRRVFEFCRHAGVPVVVTLGGGYADPVERTAEAHVNTFQVAAAVYGVNTVARPRQRPAGGGVHTPTA